MLRRFVVVLVGVLVLGAVGVSSAFAFPTHLLSGSFSGSGASALLVPEGVAVNEETGEVYVIDSGHSRVEEFDSTGSTVLGQFDGAAAGHALSFLGYPSPAIAVDNSANPLDPSRGDVYVASTGSNVVEKFSASGTYLGQIAETTVGAPLGTPFGVAVDPNGVVWVYQASEEIDSFSDALANEYLSKRLSPFEAVNAGLAVDSEDNLYVVGGSGLIGKINSSGEVLIEALDRESARGAAINLSSGEVFVDNSTEGGGSVGVFSSSGSPLERFGGGTLSSGGAGIAVNATNDRVYVTDSAAGVVDVFDEALLAGVETGAASSIAPTGMTLNGTVDPEGVPVISCFFEYGTGTSYGQRVPCAQSPGSGNAPVAVTATLIGLTEGTTYHFRLVATTADGANRGSDGEVTTLPSPVIDSASATNVTAGSVDLNARIDPRGYDTTYHFEYGASTGYGASVPVPDADIGAGAGDVAVTHHLSGLLKNTTYHWRVVAHNGNGTANGLDHTFIYSTSGTTGLPDGRAYEMVTPPVKNGGAVGDVFLGLSPDVSESGSRVVLSSIQCFGDSTSCPADEGTVGTPYEFTRAGRGWSATALAPPATRFAVNNGFTSSADASSELFSMPTPPVGEDDWYARRADGSFQDIGPMTPPSAGILGQPLAEDKLQGTSDLSHLAYESVPFWPFDQTTVNGNGLYHSLDEYVGVGNTAPVLVGVSGGAGSTDLISKCGTELGNTGKGVQYGALSGDGRTVFFTAERCASGSGVNAGVEVPADELFARIDESRTVPISQRSTLGCSAPSGCLGSPAGAARFVSASEDGSRAFFLDTQQLTDNASEDNHSGDTAYASGCVKTAGVNGCNLYEYDFSAPAGRNLVAVSAGDSSGGGPRVQGVLAMSPDGSHVYFVAQGVLSTAGNDRGQTARAGADNLYLFERDASNPEGQVSFITTVPTVDGVEIPSEWTEGFFPANVTPDGRFLVFTSHGALTADDSSTTGGSQVFRYDAVTGRLVRISVGEGGFNDNGNAGVGNAFFVTYGTKGLGYPRSDPTMSHDGSYVFFESPVALTPGALNDVPVGGIEPESPTGAEPAYAYNAYAYNVYEWHEGHVYLLSDGRDVSATHTVYCHSHQSSVCLLGGDATGSNVFFTTSDSLVAADADTGLDVYDARVCTASEPCIASNVAPMVACQGEACHGTPGPAPGSVGAATSTFSGPGNLAPPAPASRGLSAKKAPVKCAKGKRAKSGRCVKTRRSKRAKGKRAGAKRAKSTHGGKK